MYSLNPNTGKEAHPHIVKAWKTVFIAAAASAASSVVSIVSMTTGNASSFLSATFCEELLKEGISHSFRYLRLLLCKVCSDVAFEGYVFLSFIFLSFFFHNLEISVRKSGINNIEEKKTPQENYSKRRTKGNVKNVVGIYLAKTHFVFLLGAWTFSDWIHLETMWLVFDFSF